MTTYQSLIFSPFKVWELNKHIENCKTVYCMNPCQVARFQLTNEQRQYHNEQTAGKYM